MYFLSKKMVFRSKSAVEWILESLRFRDDKEKILHIKSAISDESPKTIRRQKPLT